MTEFIFWYENEFGETCSYTTKAFTYHEAELEAIREDENIVNCCIEVQEVPVK